MEYKSLFKKFKEQNPREVFAYFPYDRQAGETWEAPFKRLAQLAKKKIGHSKDLNTILETLKALSRS